MLDQFKKAIYHKGERGQYFAAERELAIEKELGEAKGLKETLEGEIETLDLELAWISRCEDALPTVGKLVEETKSLEQLPPLPDVASDFVPRTRAARGRNIEHGTVYGYTVGKCSCAECLRAKREYERARAAKAAPFTVVRRLPPTSGPFERFGPPDTDKARSMAAEAL